MTQDIEQFRAGFEAWARSNNVQLTKDLNGNYYYPQAKAAWAAWTTSKLEASTEPSSTSTSQAASIDTNEFRTLAMAWSDAATECDPSLTLDGWNKLISFIDARNSGAAPGDELDAAEGQTLNPETQEQLEKGRWCEVSGEPRNKWAAEYDRKHGISAIATSTSKEPK